MEELLSCTFAEVADGLLCDAILEVSVDPAKGKTLSLCAETVELFIVAVVVEDADAKFGSHGGKDYTKVRAISKEMEQRR
jgi:hypothetical protein